MNSSIVSIYVCHHKPGVLISDEVYKPIQLGKALTDVELNILSDNVGENISDKNKSFCELTAQYWMWKNDSKSDWLGLLHYRRYLNFCKQGKQDLYGYLYADDLGNKYVKEYGIEAESVLEYLSNKNIDMVLPQKWDVRNIGFKNIKDHYVKSEGHIESDLDVVRDVIAELYPEYLKYWDSYLLSYEGYFTNMFLMSRDSFGRYSKWMFDILFKVEEKIDISLRNVVEKRVFGYLSERLLNVYALKNIDEKKLKVSEVNRVYVENTDLPTNFDSVQKDDDISICVTCDNNYAPHLGAMVASVLDNMSSPDRLEVLVLDGGISDENKYHLTSLVKEYGGRAIHFIYTKGLFNDVGMHGHFAVATLYRLNLTEILPNYKKILYVDVDTIVLGDVAEIYNMDLGDNVVAAVPDYIMRSFVNTNVLSLMETGGVPAGEYLSNYLKLRDVKSYFQAGIISFDLEKLRDMCFYEKANALMRDKVFWFLDQDVLNILLEGRVSFLSPSWNFVNVKDDIYEKLSYNDKNEYDVPLSKIKMIHYAGHETKPWNNPVSLYAELYWKYLRLTVWYESVFLSAYKLASHGPVGLTKKKGVLFKIVRMIWRMLPVAVKRRLQSVKLKYLGQ